MRSNGIERTVGPAVSMSDRNKGRAGEASPSSTIRVLVHEVGSQGEHQARFQTRRAWPDGRVIALDKRAQFAPTRF